MSGVDRFCARVDAARIEDLTAREIRTRLEWLDAELEQLTHDQKHVEEDCYGREKVTHLHKIQKERSAALEKKARYTVALGALT